MFSGKVALEKGVFKTVDCKVRLFLPPVFTGNLEKGIDIFLNRFLMKYNKDVKGVILSYDKIRRIEKHTARVLPDSPFIAVPLVVQFLVFAPEVGSRLVGTVNKQSSDHIGITVFGAFNAAIASVHLPTDLLRWNQESGEWIHKTTGNTISVGDELPFTLLDSNISNDAFSMVASLDLENSDERTMLEDVAETLKKEKRKRRRESETGNDDKKLATKKSKKSSKKTE